MSNEPRAPSLAALAAELAAALDDVLACDAWCAMPDLTRVRIELALQRYEGYAG